MSYPWAPELASLLRDGKQEFEFVHCLDLEASIKPEVGGRDECTVLSQRQGMQFDVG